MNATNSDRVLRSFSRSFGTYHACANQQAWIAEKLVTEMQKNGAPQQFAKTLELGCGTGILTELLLKEFKLNQLTLNDLTANACQTAKTCNADFLPGDAARIDWPTKPDLIASSSMIQWLTDPALFLRRAATALAPGGWLAVSGFGIRQFHELVTLGTTARAPGLCGPEEMMKVLQSDLEIMAVGQCLRSVNFASPRDVLEHLRKTGVNGRASMVWSKSRLRRFTEDYIRRFSDAAGVTLSYHPTWIIARKPD